MQNSIWILKKLDLAISLIIIEEIEEECCNLEVPSMILQPVFENAIKHGVYESIDPVDLKFKCEEADDYMKITISNNYDEEAVPHKGEGIGISNIQSRLRMIYNQDNLLKFSKKDGIFTVTIFIPIS